MIVFFVILAITAKLLLQPKYMITSTQNTEDLSKGYFFSFNSSSSKARPKKKGRKM